VAAQLRLERLTVSIGVLCPGHHSTLDMILGYIEASHKTRRVVHESRSEGAVLTVEESAGLRLARKRRARHGKSLESRVRSRTRIYTRVYTYNMLCFLSVSETPDSGEV
jgi:hypothetical protein